MSLFGKILALLNVFGAIGLFVLAVADYGKRQAWSYSVMQHELALRGLPLDGQEADNQGFPLVDRLADNTVSEMFAQAGGNPVKTQVAEVERVKALFEAELAKLTAADGKPLARQQTELLARILLPLSSNYLERDELLAARYYFASDARLAEFQMRYRNGFEDAMKRISQDVKAGPQMSFEESMQVSMRAQGGELSDAFTLAIINALPGDVNQLKATNFDAVFVKTAFDQLEVLRAKMQAKFALALTRDGQSSPGQAPASQKRVIARTLFALCQPIAEIATKEDPKLKPLDPASFAYAQALVDTNEFKTALKRVYVVCGLRGALPAIAEETSEIRRQTDAAVFSQEQDLVKFIGDHDALVEELRDRYEQLEAARARVKDNEAKLKAQTELVDVRKAEVTLLRNELTALQSETKKSVDSLRDTSDKVLKLRLAVRDKIKETGEAEKEIRRLEGIIQAAEKKTKAKE